jgi:hypothetical protein
MKKHFKLVAAVAALIVVTTAVVTFEACNKKNEVVSNNSTNDVVSILPNASTDEYLLDLRNRMKNATKDGEAMTITDAEWALTALENFGFCDGSKRSKEMIVDTFYTRIRVSDSKISLYNLNLAYENNKSQIMNKFNSIIGDDKNIYWIMCDIDNSLKEDSATVKTIVSIRNGDDMGNPMRFESTDYWYDFNGKGKCDSYVWQYEGRDAVTEMNTKVLANIPQYECVNGRVYFTNIINFETSSLEYQNQCLDSPYEDCCLYLNTTNCNRCLTPSELNWYLDSILGYIDSIESYCNKYIIEFELIPGSILGDKDVPDLWIMYLYFGDINCTHQPMDD